MIILVLNCGSSSLKYQVLDMRSDNDYSLLAKGLVERIGELWVFITTSYRVKIKLPWKNR